MEEKNHIDLRRDNEKPMEERERRLKVHFTELERRLDSLKN